MEILFVSHKYPPFTGGMEKQSFELIAGMKPLAKVHTLVYDGTGSKLAFFLTIKSKIDACCRHHPGIGLIHFNDGLMGAFCLGFKKHPHIKRAVTFHGLDVVFPNRFYQRNIFPKFNRYHCLIAVSHATAGKVIARGIDPLKVVTILNGVDINMNQETLSATFFQKFQQQTGVDLFTQKILLSVGRAVKRKGFSWFITQVLPLLKQNVVYIMAGPFNNQPTFFEKVLGILPVALRKQLVLLTGFTNDEADIRTLLAHPVLASRIYHAGRVNNTDLKGLMGCATAFVMPNIKVPGDMEGFGLVCLEAVLNGASVYASAVDGITDAIIHQKNGYLLPAGDAQAWANILNKLLIHNQHLAPKSSLAMAYTIQHYGWQKMSQQYHEAFLQCIHKKD